MSVEPPARADGTARGTTTTPAAAGRAARITNPLTLGTAGHIDHGKTALVRALTGVDTDRLPEERRRGISIALGYAPLELPGGRRLSVVDVPGHERFVRTMVAGATGIDLYLLTIAADDGVMPQTLEHVAVLRALGVRDGVVAITKADVADPAAAAIAAGDLLPGMELVPCSARTGAGVGEVRTALARVAERLPGRAGRPGAAVLHVDRAFTVKGAGTVVTGTLWSGTVGRGDALVLLPADRRVRVRGVQVHDATVDRAEAGQRVAVNLTGVDLRAVHRGDVLAAPDAGLRPTYILDCDLALRGARPGLRVHVHHGTREAPARLADLGDGFWQLRLEAPLLAAAGDRVVVRSVAPPDTLGGGTVLDPHARKHGRRAEVVERLRCLRRGGAGGDAAASDRGGAAGGPAKPPGQEPEQGTGTIRAAPLSAAARALEVRLREAGHEPPREEEIDRAALGELRAAGRAVRVGRAMWAHPDALAAVRERVARLVERDGAVTLAGLRDDLATSRKYAQALLEHLDASRVTRRLPDDRRVLRRRTP